MDDRIAFGLTLTIFYFFHSFLASEKVKGYLYKNLISFRYYRLFYNLMAILLLIPVVLAYKFAERPTFFEATLTGKIIGSILILTGLLLWRECFRNYSGSEFLGIDRIKNKLSNQYKLLTGGLNSWVRHPLYSISYLVIGGFFLLFPNELILLLFILTGIYFPIGIYFEEQKLIRVYGESYKQYQESTPKLFPDLKKIMSKLNPWK